MRPMRLTTPVVTAITMLLLPWGLWAQVSFDISAVVRPGDPAPVPKELITASSPSLNDAGQVAYIGDGILFLRSGPETVPIVGIGDAAPGGGTFLTAQSPSLNARGEVAFVANALAPNRSGVFLYANQRLIEIARIPGSALSGSLFNAFGSLALNVRGQVVFGIYNGLFGPQGIEFYSDGLTTRIVRLGMPAPGGGTFRSFSAPTLDDHGHVAFWGETSTDRSGIFLFMEGSIVSRVRSGDPAPGGGIFTAFSFPFLNNRGEIAFVGTASPPSRNGIYVYTNKGIRSLVRAEDPAPAQGLFTNFAGLRLNDAGQVVFSATLSDGTTGLFLFSGGKVIKIVRPADPAPEGDTFVPFITTTLALNQAGQVAFTGRTIDRGVGAYLFSDSEIARLAGRGDRVTRTPKFYLAHPLAINGIGAVAFRGHMSPGGEALLDENLFVWVRTGDPAPGGGVFTSFISAALSDFGQLAFAATLSNSDPGVFLAYEEKIYTIARPGDPAPGGGTFRSASSPSINRQGQVVFTAVLSTGGTGVFLFTEGSTMGIARTGDPAPGGRTFQALQAPQLNDQGLGIFWSNLMDSPRTGFFMFSDASIQPIVQVGDPGPLGPPFISLSDAALSSTGRVAFTGAAEGIVGGMFLHSPEGIRLLVRGGDPAPGGGTLGFLSGLSLNALGQVAFSASLSTGSYGGFLFWGGEINIIARPGDPAPGGDTFVLVAIPRLNDQGQVLFLGALSSGATGVFLASPR